MYSVGTLLLPTDDVCIGLFCSIEEEDEDDDDDDDDDKSGLEESAE